MPSTPPLQDVNPSMITAHRDGSTEARKDVPDCPDSATFFSRYTNEDDLGEYNGTTFYPTAGDARRSIEKYDIHVGNRPEDHRARDLWIASTLRDPRCWKFRKMSKAPPEWIRDMALHIGPNLQRAGQQILALCYLHKIHLGFLREYADDVTDRVLDQLWNCWPYGATFTPRVGDKSPRDICGLAHVCPFCLARSVNQLYERLCLGPWCDPGSSFLVLAKASFPSFLLNRDSRFFAKTNRIKAIRDILGRQLQTQAKDFGACGGLTVLQVGPQRTKREIWSGAGLDIDNNFGFSYQLSVLAEVRNPTIELINFINGASASGVSAVDVGGAVSRVEWSVQDGADPSALRASLFGTSMQFRRGREPESQAGAFVVPPWHLSTYDQWREHLIESKGTRLFNLWGRWRGTVPPAEPERKAERFVNAPSRRGEHRRRAAFKQKNQERWDEATRRRQQLADESTDTWIALRTESRLPPGWRKLKRAIEDSGKIVSELDSRWLAKHFRTLDGCVPGAEA